MRRPIKVWHLVLALALLLGVSRLHAQNGAVTYFQPASGTTVANCGTPTAGSPAPLCGVATGWFIWNGTTWTQIPQTAVAGVTSWNGQTGAVTYNPPAAPVSSVNGKTGAVVLTLQ